MVMTEMESLALLNRAEVSCVLADDHPAILDALERFLTASGFGVVAATRDGEAALEAVEAKHPSVCVADVWMPRLDGLELARRLDAAGSETAVLLYSGRADSGLLSDALDAGARGLALKDAPLDDLARAIDAVAAGSVYVDPVLAASLAMRGRNGATQALSPREREVLRLLAEGDSYHEIGAVLFLAPDTVRAHAQRAMTKLGARTRTQAVALAVRERLIA